MAAWLVPWFSLSVVLFLSGASMARSEEEKPVTFRELLDKGIVQLIDKEFVLKAKVAWAYMDVKIPEDPTPMETLRQRAAGLTVPFEGPGFEKVSGKKHLGAGGPDLVKKAGADRREVYAYKDLVLVNGTREYLLKVRLKLRPAFKRSYLDNPAFVKQSNDPRYWAQTFELEILGISPTP